MAMGQNTYFHRARPNTIIAFILFKNLVNRSHRQFYSRAFCQLDHRPTVITCRRLASALSARQCRLTQDGRQLNRLVNAVAFNYSLMALFTLAKH